MKPHKPFKHVALALVFFLLASIGSGASYFPWVVRDILAGEESHDESVAAHRMIAPIFGAMLADQLFIMWENRKTNVKEQEPHKPVKILLWLDDHGVLADDILAWVKQRGKQDSRWREFHSRLFVSNVESSNTRLFREAEAGSIIVVFLPSRVPKKIEEFAETANAEVASVVCLPELEYVKDRFGRQILTLDNPKLRQEIFERLVRGGMNPLDARSAVERSVERFRTDRDAVAGFLRKMS